MLSILKPVHRFLLPCFVLTGGLLYAGGVDKTSAEGEIAAGGAVAKFSLNASDPSDPSGHLNYRDEETGLQLRSTGITAYIVSGATTRRIEGTGILKDGTTVTWVVNVIDGGPGTSDQFAIAISNGYADNGFLKKGNVRITPAP